MLVMLVDGRREGSNYHLGSTPMLVKYNTILNLHCNNCKINKNK